MTNSITYPEIFIYWMWLNQEWNSLPSHSLSIGIFGIVSSAMSSKKKTGIVKESFSYQINQEKAILNNFSFFLM